MAAYPSGETSIHIEQYEPTTPEPSPALVLLHGSGGASRYWLDRFAPAMASFGIATYAPHYFAKTGTTRATAEIILDGRHFPLWLAAARDSLGYVAARPRVDARRIGLLGISLGGYLAVALASEDPRVRATIELSGGLAPGWEDRLSPRTSPILILHGERDHVVPVSEAHKLAAVLAARQVPHSVELFAEETHWFSSRAQPRLLLRCAAFLQQSLK